MFVPAARQLALGAVIVALALAIASCHTGQNPPSTGSPLPPRPASIDLEGRQPCGLVDEGRRRQLDIDAGTPRTLSVRDTDAPTCTYLGRSVKIDSNVQFLPVPASALAALPGASLSAVDGYGVVTNRDDSDVFPGCDVSVDVNDSWSLRVQSQAYPDDLRAAALTEQSLCERSSDLVSFVLSDLTGR